MFIFIGLFRKAVKRFDAPIVVEESIKIFQK